MAYTNRPGDNVVMESVPVERVVDYHDRVRWGPIISGLVVALTTQLILSALGAAIGLSGIAGSGAPRTNAGDVGVGVGIWAIVSFFISLLLGSWVAASACGPINRKTALLNGTILWATALVLGSWLLVSGVTGAFGVAAANAGDILNQVQQGGGAVTAPDPNLTAEQTRAVARNAATAGWSFVFGSLLGLVASLIGASLGARSPRSYT